METAALSTQCARIREKSVRARTQFEQSRDKDRVFGADSHKFLLAPPLAEKTIAAFEEKYGIALPLEYRAFLTQVGSQGAGPYYGLKSLDKWDEGILWNLADEKQAAVLAHPCPLREGMDVEEDAWLSEAGGDDWEERFNRDEWSPYSGCLTLCDQGCALYSLLVVTGNLRGRIINANWVYGFGVSHQPNFLDWYEGWLDKVLSGEKIGWY